MEEVNVNHQLLQERNATQKKNAVGQSFEPFVVPGNVTDVNQYPFIAALIYRLANGSATHFCGGTLITSKLILTATHCLQGFVSFLAKLHETFLSSL
jgi:secreted trypsin-like serine protease